METTNNEDKQLNAMRHTSIHDPYQYRDKRVTVIGLGTIGSWLVQILSRMQVPMNLYDHDTVEEHNLTTQTYGQADIGKTKVEALMEQLLLIQPENSHFGFSKMYDGKMEEDVEDTSDYIVSAVDSIKARKEIAQMLIDRGIEKPIVDGRVGREQAEVYYFPNASAWLEQLPEEGDTDPCGARFTAYTAVEAAGFMANNIKRLLMEQEIHAGRIIYDNASLTFIKEK